MLTLLVAIFLLAYTAIVLKHFLKINKSASALIYVLQYSCAHG